MLPQSILCNVLYNYAKKRTGLETLHTEMAQPSFLTGDATFDGDDVVFKFYNEEIFINLKRDNNSFIITGFNHLNSGNITYAWMDGRYLDFLRAMKLIRSGQYRSKDLK